MKVICLLHKETLPFFLSFNPVTASSPEQALAFLSGLPSCLLLLEESYATPDFLEEVEKANSGCRILLLSDSSLSSTQTAHSCEMLRDILTSECVNDLIYGHPERLAGLSSLIQLNGLHLTPQLVLTVVFDNFWSICEARDNTYRYKLKRILLNAVRKILKESYSTLAATLTGTDKVVVLLDCQGLTGEAAEGYGKDCACMLVQEVKELTGYSISIGLSKFCSAPALLSRFYEQSFRALEQSFQAGNGQVLLYQTPLLQHTGASSRSAGQESFLEQIKKELIIGVTEQKNGLCTNALERLSAECALRNAEPSYIKSLMVSLLSEIGGYCLRMGLDPIDISGGILAVTGSIFKSTTMNDVKKEVYQFLCSLSQKLKADIPESTPLDMAAAYLEQYYANSPRLIEMADLCGYSPSYFSRAFKEHFGINFIRYLKDIQIRNSKKLLLESDLNLSEICEKTGFQNISYFSFFFKKETGVSPAQYRAENKK